MILFLLTDLGVARKREGQQRIQHCKQCGDVNTTLFLSPFPSLGEGGNCSPSAQGVRRG
jgi:hypothetical protein